MRSIAIALTLLCLTAAPCWADTVWDCVGQDCQHLAARTGDTFDATDANSSIPGPVESSAPSCGIEGQVYFNSTDHFLYCCDGSSWAECATSTTDTNTWCGSSETCDLGDVGVTGTPDGTKFLRDDSTWQAVPGGGGAPSFDTITNGTNITATAMVVGNTATLSPSGTGTITANRTACGATTELMGGNTGAPTCYDETLWPRLLGRSGGQDLIGGTTSGDDLTLESTSHGTKGDISLKDKLFIGANFDADVNTVTPFFAVELLDGVNMDLSAVGAHTMSLLHSDAEFHLGQAATNPATSFIKNKMVFNYDDTNSSVILVPWTFNNESRIERSTSSGVFLLTGQAFRDTQVIALMDAGAAWTVLGWDGYFAGATIESSVAQDITVTDWTGLTVQPTFQCTNASANCTATNVYGLRMRASNVNSGAGTEAITNRWGLHVVADSIATNDMGVYTEVPIQVSPDSLTAGATFQITPSAGYIEMNAGGAVTSNATTAILAGVDGQLLTVANTDTGSDIITIKDNANTQMDGDFAMNPGDTISFIYDATETDWLETGRGDNDSSDAGGGSGDKNHGFWICHGDSTFDSTNSYSCMGTSTTASDVEWEPNEALTVTAFKCSQGPDGSCAPQLQAAENGTPTGSNCTLSGVSTCSVSGLSIGLNGTTDGFSIEATGGSSNCSGDLYCFVEFDYD